MENCNNANNCEKWAKIYGVVEDVARLNISFAIPVSAETLYEPPSELQVSRTEGAIMSTRTLHAIQGLLLAASERLDENCKSCPVAQIRTNISNENPPIDPSTGISPQPE